ncbi:MAG TPA: hypothetical protein VMZ00_12900 [Sporichthya sp.]|nr:hypothetical protein [Sporichthya sp.]
MIRPRTPNLLVTSALGLAFVAVPALPAAAGDGPTVTKDGATYTLKVHETENGSTFIPKGGEPAQQGPQAPPSPGDAFGFTSDLTQGATDVGTDSGTCTFLTLDPDSGVSTNHCVVTLKFANGTLTVDDTLKFADAVSTFQAAIASGTGAFAGAAGTLTVHELDNKDVGSESDLTAVYTLGGGGSQVAEVPMGGAATGGGLASSADDTAVLIGLGGLVALAGFGLLAGGRRLATTRR